MTLSEYYGSKIPDYYHGMYRDGYSPEQILFAAHRQMWQEYQDRQAVDEIKITSEVKLK